MREAPDWLVIDWILAAFAERKNQHSSPWEELKNQIYLGSDAFVAARQGKLDENRR